MNTRITEITKNPILIVIFSFLLTILLVFLMVTGLVMPSYKAYSEATTLKSDVEVKLNKVTTNIELVKGVDDTQRQDFLNFMNTFYPESPDHLHFAVLNEEVSKRRNIKVTNFTTSKGVSSTQAATSPSIGPAAGSSSKTTPAPTTSTAGSDNNIFVSVSYKGKYEDFESLLVDLRKLDRLVGIDTVVLTKVDGTDEITANVSYNLPIAPKSLSTGTSENILLLTDADKNLIKKLKENVEFFAKPSEKNVGKNDPFE